MTQTVESLSEAFNEATAVRVPELIPPMNPSTARLHQSVAHVLVTESPLHAWRMHRQLGAIARAATKSMEFGTVVHKLVLGKGEEFEVLDFDSYRTNASKAERAAASEAGKVPILAHDFARAKESAASVLAKLSERGISLVGHSEHYVEWEEETSGGHTVLCAGTFDHLIVEDGHGRIYDLKTGESANPAKIERKMYDFGADIQWAAYTSAADRKYALQGRVDMQFLFAETSDPFCLTVARPDGTMRTLGQRRWERAKDLWHSCVTRNEWPEYSTGVVEISAPPWALKKEMEDE